MARHVSFPLQEIDRAKTKGVEMLAAISKQQSNRLANDTAHAHVQRITWVGRTALSTVTSRRDGESRNCFRK